MGVETLESLAQRAGAGDPAAQLDLADRLDAEGRHTDAINVLSRAARLGNVTAKGRVGARILVGDRAPSLPADGARLILEAAEEGDAEAAAIAAVLAGAGAHRTQSWADALELLARAAALGLEHARAQLLLLASDRGLAEAAKDGSAPADVWRRLAASVDVAALTTPPPGRTLSGDPLIRAYDGFAGAETCAWLIDRARGRLKRAQIYNSLAQRDEVSETRTNSLAILNLLQSDVVSLLLQARIGAATGLPFAHMEALGVLHYDEGEVFGDHYDFIDPKDPNYEAQIARDGQRVVTFLLYLNDDFEGGETAFPRLGIAHRGAAGGALFFWNALASGEADTRTLHAGRAPTRGEKWVVTQWIRNRPAVPGVRL